MSTLSWSLLLLLSLTGCASVCAAVLPWMGEYYSSLVYGRNLEKTDPMRCNCMASKTDVPVYSEICGPMKGYLVPGQQYRSLNAFPIHACNRRWLLLQNVLNNVVMWLHSEEPGVDCDCPQSLSGSIHKHNQRVPDNEPSAKLVKCVCQIESQCNPKTPCLQDRGSLSCGPFQIKEPYWIDASRIAHRKLGGDWINCTTGPDNMACSVEAFQVYVGNYGPKCATPATDEVYARVHNGGPKGCQKSGTVGYWNKVKACMGKLGRDIL